MNSSRTTKKNRRKKKKSIPLAAATAGGNSGKAVPMEVPSQDRGGGSGPSSAPRKEGEEGADEERKRTLDWLAEAFPLVSIEEVGDAFWEAEGDADRAAEILGGRGDGKEVVYGRRKQKKMVVAVTGLVSDVIGKGYGNVNVNGHGVRSAGERCDLEGGKGGGKERCVREEAEEFLFEMIGDSCDLGDGVIRDVFGNCGYDVEMALVVLLDLSASSNKQHKNTDCDNLIPNKINYLGISQERSFDGHGNNNTQVWKSMDNTSDSNYQPHGKVVNFPRPALYDSRQHTKVHGSSLEYPPSLSESTKQELPQRVLESFFNVTDISKYEPNCMNWKKVVKKLEAFGEGFELNSSDTTATPQQGLNDFEDGYHKLRSVARQHWDTMKSYYQKAALAYAKGERATAAFLSEQGKYFSKLAREADEKASRDIFEAKNKNIQNVVTIDLHGQHVQQAMILLKFHALMLTYSPAIQLLRVITGSGTHGMRKGKLKQSVIDFLKKEGIHWREENSGTLVIKVDRFKEYNFVKADSESE